MQFILTSNFQVSPYWQLHASIHVTGHELYWHHIVNVEIKQKGKWPLLWRSQQQILEAKLLPGKYPIRTLLTTELILSLGRCRCWSILSYSTATDLRLTFGPLEWSLFLNLTSKSILYRLLSIAVSILCYFTTELNDGTSLIFIV